MNINTGTTVTLASGTSITVGSDVTGAGTLTTGGSTRTINFGGNWSHNGTSSGAGLLVVANGTGTQTISAVISSGPGSLTVNKTSGSVVLGLGITVANFILTAGTFDPSNYLFTISTAATYTTGTLRVGAGTWAGNYSSAITEPASGTIEYYASGAQTINNVAYAR